MQTSPDLSWKELRQVAKLQPTYIKLHDALLQLGRLGEVKNS